MTVLSRREFGRVVIASVPLTAAITSIGLNAAGPLAFGVSTSSFRDLPRVTGRDNVDAVIAALRAVRATRIELALANVEPAPPSTAPFMGGSNAYPRRIVLTPEQVAATNSEYRAALRVWRLQTPLSAFETVRSKCVDAGLTLDACAVACDESFTDDELDTVFRQVKALGATTVSSPLTMAMARRLAPLAAKHQIAIAIHNQVDGNSAGAIATPDLTAALALSPSYKLALDIGNLTASNCDATAELRDHHARVSHVLVKDRLRNGGASQPFGEGDTPIAAVLDVLRTSAPGVPALVEYDYTGLRSSVEEVTASMAYLAKATR
jgi:hypothetical protein